MDTSSTSPYIVRRQLNELQLELLQILYKFRFANVKLISQYQDQTIRNSNVRLKNLLEQDYIGRIYDNSFRLSHRPAVYYILPKAIRLLKADEELDQKGLHLLYYNRSAKPVFINHCMRVFRIYLKLSELYGDDLEFYTNTELADQQQFPSPRPDAYLLFSGKHAKTPECFLDLLESNKSRYYIRQRVLRILDHYESSKWIGKYPDIFLVCDNIGLEREIQYMVKRELGNRGLENPTFRIRTLAAVLSAKDPADIN